MGAEAARLPQLTLNWWRGPLRLMPASRVLRANRESRLVAPLRELDAFTAELPPGLMHGEQPAYVWFANAAERQPQELLDLTRAIGPLSGSSFRGRFESTWRNEESGARFFRLALLSWFALQEHDEDAMFEVARLAMTRTVPPDSASPREIGIGEGVLPMDADLLGLIYQVQDRRHTWSNLALFIDSLLTAAWQSVARWPTMDVPAGPGPVRASLRFMPRDLFSFLSMQLYLDMARGRLVRGCANPHCTRNQLFLAQRRTRRYCSKECQNAVMQSRYRKRQAARRRGSADHGSPSGKGARGRGGKKKRRSRRKSKS